MSEQENNPIDEAIEGTVLETHYTMDKETLLEAERVVTDNLPKIEESIKSMRKTFFQSAIIRTGAVLVALRIVTIAGNIVTERMRENKKSEEK